MESTPARLSPRPLWVARHHLGAFRPPDCIRLRDAKARSSKPSLLASSGAMLAVGDFTIQYSYTVSREMGVQFVDVTGDANEIHRTTDIVAGALTASKVILPLEVLFPTLRITETKVKFTNFCRYGRRCCASFQVRLAQDSQVRIEVRVYQEHEPVAECSVTGVALAETPRSSRLGERRVEEAELKLVRDFFDSCNIDSEAYFQKDGFRDYTYPFAYVASLPSAALVRELHGQGGMLNVLTMQFADAEKIPIGPQAPPQVRIQEGRKRSAFTRIITDIIDGVVTYYKGSAIVNPDSGML